ncbi:uncharacterized protein [Asterias amurensis]|uniref:uncharacterized protein n=1 Tax=Asterias amurensis TaxID=7602 RepID=UPI003AB46ED6
MCRNGSGWDDPLPAELGPRWEKWMSDLPKIAAIRIPRCLKPSQFSEVKSTQLHHFSDASTLGYGQCSYLRIQDHQDRECSTLLMGKSRVAPTKITTIPHLELTAAVVSVKISQILKEELHLTKGEEIFWTDSQVVLGYINNEARRFHTFVANRVQMIRESTDVGAFKERPPSKDLDPFTDDSGILRVGGRLRNSSLPLFVKHPVIFPKDSHISRLIAAHFHEKVHHQGRGITLNELRANGFWIICGGGLISSLIRKCVICRRNRRPTQEQKMADLPEDRVESSPPFSYCGMDCFGPFITKQGRKNFKRYGLLFTCLCSRAVHVELLDDLSTDAFINGLPLPLPPPGKFVPQDMYLRKRWRRVQYLTEQFWSRWRKEHLQNLNRRQCWAKPRRNIEVGDIVLILEPEVARNRWPMGVVVVAAKDKDNLVRKAKVQVGTRKLNQQGKREVKLTFLERPVQKLVLLLEST